MGTTFPLNGLFWGNLLVCCAGSCPSRVSVGGDLIIISRQAGGCEAWGRRFRYEGRSEWSRSGGGRGSSCRGPSCHGAK